MTLRSGNIPLGESLSFSNIQEQPGKGKARGAVAQAMHSPLPLQCPNRGSDSSLRREGSTRPHLDKEAAQPYPALHTPRKIACWLVMEKLANFPGLV